jgi:hypothetical protein
MPPSKEHLPGKFDILVRASAGLEDVNGYEVLFVFLWFVAR